MISWPIDLLDDAGEIPREPHALDRRLRSLSRRLQTRDRRLGELACGF